MLQGGCARRLVSVCVGYWMQDGVVVSEKRYDDWLNLLGRKIVVVVLDYC